MTATYAACVPTNIGLVAWWGGNSDFKSQVGKCHAKAHGEVAFSPGEVGEAFNLDGVNTFVSAAADPMLDIGAGRGFTIEMWIKPATDAGNQPLLEWDKDGKRGVRFWLYKESGQLYANLADANGTAHTLYTGAGIIRPRTLQHVALTYDKNEGVACIYRNGVLMARQNVGVFTPRTDGHVYLGWAREENAYYAGVLDEVSLYDRCLGETALAAIFKAGEAGKCFK